LSARVLILAGLAAVLASPVLAAAPGPIQITGAWTRPVARGQTDAGYLTITNAGKTADRLLSAASPQTGKIEMHLSEMVGDMSTMKSMAAGLALAPGQTVRFEPGGYHLMLEDLKSEEKLGGAVPVTLTFAHAGKIKVAFAVAAGPPK
jgi:copper(I)-binding protein